MTIKKVTIEDLKGIRGGTATDKKISKHEVKVIHKIVVKKNGETKTSVTPEIEPKGDPGL